MFPAEIDISVSKLLGFETFANFLRVLVSVSENLVSEKKVSVSVSVKILVSSFSGKGGMYGIQWDHQVGLMSLQMIHEAYKPVYM